MTENLVKHPVDSGKAIHPKTFHVIIRPPFGLSASQGLSMYVHCDNWQDVLGWVESTFPGVDTRPTVARKNAVPGSRPRVGNCDPVVIHDVDVFGITERAGGKFVRSPAPAGHWRRNAEDVVNDLFKVATFLREQSVCLTRSFQSLRHQYERGHTQPWAYDRLLELKAAIKHFDVWQDNVWGQYCAARPRRDLRMPELRRAADKLPAAIEGTIG